MASEKHKELASFIKGVHQNLRIKSRTLGPDQAWREHCQNTEELQKYAENMQQLAKEYWAKNNCEDSNLCRVQWVVKECEEYFLCGGHKKAFEKEEKLCRQYFENYSSKMTDFSISNKDLNLLDVGSCYNPFSKFPLFNVTAIDLMPATPDVLKCDFLQVSVSKESKLVENPSEKLPEQHFDVVVFSLLLEYFPTPQQRLVCCQKAWKLLKPAGLLFILTPDSKHATANSQVMKSWRMALATLGFWRISYQKQKHLHCMAYRKCINEQVTQCWFQRQQCDRDVSQLLYIPQDNHEYCDKHSGEETLVPDRSETDNILLADHFTDLPDFGSLED